MNTGLTLKHKAINGWPLFWLISAPLSLWMLAATIATDLGTPAGVSHMIQTSVRWAVPFIFVVAATSALQQLFPGSLSKWLLRNRRYVGLCFAVAMAWQGFFIFLMSNFHTGYYYEEVFYLRDELEGSTGYLFLTAMVITSFRFGRRHLSQQQWKLLHTAGLYFLWAYAFSVYWWNLYYYGNPQFIDYVFYWTGFLAVAVRIAAWGKQRLQSADGGLGSLPLPQRIAGAGIVVVGVLIAATGLFWREPTTAFLLGPAWSAELVLWLPYWPFEPFFSLMAVALGTLVLTHRPAQNEVPARAG